MIHDHTTTPLMQPTPARSAAERMQRSLALFLRPFTTRLALTLDIRLVQTVLDLVQVILTHRHHTFGLLLSELGGYLLGPDHAPAGSKRISNLIHSLTWNALTITDVLWQLADTRVHDLLDDLQTPLLVWDGSVLEKPESQANPDWCVVRSSKARRLSRRRKGLTLPHTGAPILVPGLHWDGLIVVGADGPPTLACMKWWSRRGATATDQHSVDSALLERCAKAWGRQVRHIWDRGYASSAWLQTAMRASLRFVVRWKKGNKLLDPWGEERKAWEITRGKRTLSYRMLRDTHTHELVKVGVLAMSVTLPDAAQPLWLVVARLGQGREPWYLLTTDVIRSQADMWAVVEAYARRWQIEVVWRYAKSELAFESVRVQQWEAREKLLLLATLAHAFLLHLLDSSFDEMRELLLRGWCHRTGKRYQDAKAPLYRLRAALSRLWQLAPPPGRHAPLLNSG